MTPVDVLKSIFQRKVEKNHKYSLRAFARDLNLSPGRLSVILSGKEEPGYRFIKKIQSSSVWDAKEKDMFGEALQVSLGFGVNSIGPKMSLDEYESADLNSVEVHTILTLLRTEGCNDNHEWMAKRLSIDVSEVDFAIAALLHHKIIEHKDKRYVQKIEGLICDEKGSNPKQIGKKYQTFLEQTVPRLMNQEKEHSLFGTLMVALDKEDIPRVKKLLQTTFKKIEAMADKSKRTEVYNLTVINQRLSR